jgi:hypothetical protein
MSERLIKRAEDLPVGATIKLDGKVARVVAPSTVAQNDFELAGRRYRGRTVTIHTNKADVLTSLPCNVEIVD